MRISSAKKYFALLALLLCQWLMFTHVVHHAALDYEEVCQLCLHAPLNAGATAPDLPTLVLAKNSEAPTSVHATAPAASTPRYTPIRGPPTLLA
jgi:hypothetical protein